MVQKDNSFAHFLFAVSCSAIAVGGSLVLTIYDSSRDNREGLAVLSAQVAVLNRELDKLNSINFELMQRQLAEQEILLKDLSRQQAQTGMRK